MLFCQLDGFLRLFKIRACDHEFGTSGFYSSLEHILEVIVMGLLAMVYAPEDGISEIDTDLWSQLSFNFLHALRSAIRHANLRLRI